MGYPVSGMPFCLFYFIMIAVQIVTHKIAHRFYRKSENESDPVILYPKSFLTSQSICIFFNFLW